MSGSSIKRLKRSVRKEAEKIKIQGLQEFFDYSKTQPLRKRLKIMFKILFKRGIT